MRNFNAVLTPSRAHNARACRCHQREECAQCGQVLLFLSATCCSVLPFHSEINVRRSCTSECIRRLSWFSKIRFDRYIFRQSTFVSECKQALGQHQVRRMAKKFVSRVMTNVLTNSVFCFCCATYLGNAITMTT